MRSKLMFQLLNGVRPGEWFGRLIVVSNEVKHCLLQLGETSKMVGVEELTLEKTEPDLDLIEPGGVFREPVHLQSNLPIWNRVQFLLPRSQLDGEREWGRYQG